MRNTALLPAALVHSSAAARPAPHDHPRRGVASTSDATPTRRAAARLHRRADDGLPRAVSIWITVPRLTPEAAASASIVIRRC